MARSILGTVGLALTLAFAIPVAYLGVEFLLSGRTNQGLLFLGIAALMIAIEEYVTTPTDIPGMVAGRVLGTVVKGPDAAAEDGEGERVAGADDDAAGTDDAAGGTGGTDRTGPTDQGDDAADDDVLIPDAEGNSE